MLFAPSGMMTGQLLQKSPLVVGETRGQLNSDSNALITAGNRIAELGNTSTRKGDAEGIFAYFCMIGGQNP